MDKRDKGPQKDSQHDFEASAHAEKGPLKERLKEEGKEEVVVHGHETNKGDIFKFVGLIVFFVIMLVVCVLIWPFVGMIFEPGGVDMLIEQVRNAGVMGFIILLALQFLQIVVAFIPGEVVQIAAGMMYGPWLGGLLIFIGCVLSSAFIYELVHRLGAPFVQSMVPTKYLEKFRKFEDNGRLDAMVFILFLIPAMPKDVFTYLVPLTSMSMGRFLVLANVARIPGIILSTYAADGLLEGRIGESLVVFGIAALLAVIGILNRERIMRFGEKFGHKEKK